MSADLCRTFQELATRTWQRLEQAETTGLPWSEETNTETLLMTLHERHSHHVRVRAFSKHREARNGADWEWWIGAPGRWLGMRVQAKRLSASSEKFAGLQTQTAKSQPRTQIDTLIEVARADRLNPVYCFYVHSHRWPKAALWPVSGIYGCLIAHASAVRHVGSDALGKIAPVTIPWHYLVCPCSLNGTRHFAADQSHSLLRRSVTAASQAQPHPHSGGSEEGAPLFGPVAELPPHMNAMFAARAARDPDERLAQHAKERRLAGFVLINLEEG